MEAVFLNFTTESGVVIRLFSYHITQVSRYFLHNKKLISHKYHQQCNTLAPAHAPLPTWGSPNHCPFPLPHGKTCSLGDPLSPLFSPCTCLNSFTMKPIEVYFYPQAGGWLRLKDLLVLKFVKPNMEVNIALCMKRIGYKMILQKIFADVLTQR